MLTYPWKCTVLHCNHLGNTWKPLVLMTRHFDYCPNASEGDNQSVRSSAPMVSRCFPGGYNVKLYISRGTLAWWLLAFLHSVIYSGIPLQLDVTGPSYRFPSVTFLLRFSVEIILTLKVLDFWKFTSYCSLKPLWSGMGEVVPARTSSTLHPPSPPTVRQLSQLAL